MFLQKSSDKLPRLPQSVKLETKPHLFCPGCGHPLILKTLGKVIDKMGIQPETVLGIDIGCSLLAWNYFNVDTFQTHHGRTVPTMVGFKMARPEKVALVYQGDGGAYAIGLQALVHASHRNNPITVITVNNTLYAMTGGQLSPTTLTGEITDTTPYGRDWHFGKEFWGPETLKVITTPKAYLARGSVDNLPQLENFLVKAIENQTKNYSFSFVEVLSLCPVNWRTDAKETLAFLEKMKRVYPVGELSGEKK